MLFRRYGKYKRRKKVKPKFSGVGSDHTDRWMSCGTVNQNLLPCIKLDTDVRNLDWCRYTMDSLNESRRIGTTINVSTPVLLVC